MKNDFRKKSWDYDLIAMTFHESAHAIVALHNYLYVFNVSVMTPKKPEGNTEFFVYGDESTEEELKNILLIFEIQARAAGLIAEKMYYKDICGSAKFPMHLRIGSSYDISSISELIRNNNLVLPGKKTFVFKKQIQYDVEQILKEHWDAVRVIAHTLYKKKRLSFDELKYVLSRKTDHNDFWKDRFKKIKLIHNENNYPTEDIVKDIILDDAIFSI